MTEMQAAIGRLQLRKLAGWVETRRANAGVLASELSRLDALHIPLPPRHIEHAYYKFYAYVRPEALKSGWTRDRIMAEITARGVFCNAGGCCEIYREKAFARHHLQPCFRFPVAQQLGETALMLLVHPTLSIVDIAKNAEVVAEVVKEATR